MNSFDTSYDLWYMFESTVAWYLPHVSIAFFFNIGWALWTIPPEWNIIKKRYDGRSVHIRRFLDQDQN